jgi:uncharacterized membrane protein HdeD (DUF308 family)
MYVSRVIFSFKYAKSLRRYGAIWCGLAIVGIVYFAIFKGMKSSGLISDDFNHLINDHIVLSLGAIWIISSVILLILQQMKVNILKITILAGTFALLFGWILMIAGIEKISFGSKLNYFSISDYGWVNFSGIFNVIAALFFIFFPLVSTIALNMVLAIYLLVGGIYLFIEAISMTDPKLVIASSAFV